MVGGALVRRPRPTTVACGSPPVAATTAAIASASGSIDPRMAVPSQSVIDRFAASTTAGGTAASSRPSTKSTSASITGVLLVVIATSVAAVASGIGLSVGLVILMLAPVVTVIGYEVLGHQHQAEALKRNMDEVEDQIENAAAKAASSHT